MRSLLEIKTPVRSAARSYILTSPESSNVGILEVPPYLCDTAFTCGGRLSRCSCLPDSVLWLDVPSPGRLGLAEEVSRWKGDPVCQSEHQESVQSGDERHSRQICLHTKHRKTEKDANKYHKQMITFSSTPSRISS